MVQSMTAHGQSDTKTEYAEFHWEIRSLNNRFLDLTIRLPEQFRHLDSVIRPRVSAHIHRGKVDVTLKTAAVSGGADRLVLNSNLLEQLTDALTQLGSQSDVFGQSDPMSLLQWPGATHFESLADESLNTSAIQSFSVALHDFIDTRQREGEQLACMLSDRARRLTELLAVLRQQRPDVVRRQREKLLAKLAQLNVDHDVARLEQELVYAAQRLDIDEEMDRLQAHLNELLLVLKREEPIGRRLDFLLQEFNREANTIASKSSDALTTSTSIDMKVLIEQMREQVQNVE